VGFRHFPLTIRTFGTLAATFYYLSQRAILFSNHVFLRPSVGLVTTAQSCFPTTSSSVTPTSRLEPASTCFATTSSEGTPPAEVTKATALNCLLHGRGSAIFYQSSRLAILRPSSTTYPHRGIFFPTTSFSGTPYARLQTGESCISSTSFSGSPTAKVSTAAALNSTYITDGGPPSASTYPHGWHSCGYLLQTILTAPSWFPTTFYIGNP